MRAWPRTRNTPANLREKEAPALIRKTARLIAARCGKRKSHPRAHAAEAPSNNLLRRQQPLPWIFDVALEGVGEACERCAIQMPVVRHPTYVHDLAGHQLHLLIVAWQSH